MKSPTLAHGEQTRSHVTFEQDEVKDRRARSHKEQRRCTQQCRSHERKRMWPMSEDSSQDLYA